MLPKAELGQEPSLILHLATCSVVSRGCKGVAVHPGQAIFLPQVSGTGSAEGIQEADR